MLSSFVEAEATQFLPSRKERRRSSFVVSSSLLPSLHSLRPGFFAGVAAEREKRESKKGGGGPQTGSQEAQRGEEEETIFFFRAIISFPYFSPLSQKERRAQIGRGFLGGERRVFLLAITFPTWLLFAAIRKVRISPNLPNKNLSKVVTIDVIKTSPLAFVNIVSAHFRSAFYYSSFPTLALNCPSSKRGNFFLFPFPLRPSQVPPVSLPFPPPHSVQKLSLHISVTTHKIPTFPPKKRRIFLRSARSVSFSRCNIFAKRSLR